MKSEKVVYLLLQIIGLVILLVTLTTSGMGVLLGSDVASSLRSVVNFGTLTIAMSGILTGFLLKTRRHRIFRDTQIHLFKYFGTLGALQVMAMFMTGTFGLIPDELIGQMMSNVVKVVAITFSVMAFIMPVNYLKAQFNLVKAAEYRDPRKVVKSFF